MAYTIDQRGQQWHVVKESTGETLGQHSTPGDAQSHLDAIYTAEPTALVEDLMNDSFDSAADQHHIAW